MNIVGKLFELQENCDKVEANKKITLDGSYLYLLRKMKKEFEENKEKYNAKVKSIEKIKLEYASISKELKELNSKISGYVNSLYNEAGSDLKAIKALESNIKNSKTALKLLEDKAIELLETEEKLKLEIETSKTELITVKNNFYSYKNATSKKIEEANNEIRLLENEIKRLESEIPKKFLTYYNDMLKQKKKPVAILHGTVCSGCKMKVSSMTMDEIYKGKEIVLCDNCGRILLYEEVGNLKEAK